MKKDIILCGVGGQGILTIAYVIDNAAKNLGFTFKQSEVHGMSQRGGAVQSHLRISDEEICSDLIPRGSCDLIISMEPLEALRYVEFLSPTGVIITGDVPFINIGNYPEKEWIFAELRKQGNVVIVPAEQIAKEAGSTYAQNVVLIGVAASYLGLQQEELKRHIGILLKNKGDKVLDANIKAFNAGLAFGK